MHMEKNRKFPLETSRSFSREKKPLMFRINHWISYQRLNSRNKLFLNPINLATTLAVIPIVLGVSQVLPYKSRFSKNLAKPESFFEKTLPGFHEFKPKLNFETFEYISKSNTRLVEGNPKILMFGQSNFVTRIKKSDSVSPNTFNKVSCNLYFLPSGNFGSKTSSIRALARNLDELPAYVEGFKKTEAGAIPKSLFETNRNLETVNFKKSKSGKRSSVAEFQSKNIFFSANPRLKTKLPLIQRLTTKGKKTTSTELVSFLTQFSENFFEFEKTLNQINNELDTLFTEKNVCLFSNNFWEDLENEEDQLQNFRKKSLNIFFNSKDDEKNPSLETIKKLETKTISEDSPGFRLMSGYKYPDMSAEDIRWLYSRTPWKKADLVNFTIETSSLPATSQEYNFSVKDFPYFMVKQTETPVQKPKSNRVFFMGQSFVLDPQRALDWQIESNKSFQVRKWFHTYVSPKNPLIQSLDNLVFFDNFASSNVDINQEFSNLTQKSLFYFKPITENGKKNVDISVRVARSPFSPSHLSFHFSSGNKEENTRFIRTLNVDLSKTPNVHEFVSIPLLEIQRPLFNTNSNSKKFNQKFRNYSPYFTFTSKGNPDYLFSTDSLNTHFFKTKQSFGQYTKTSSLFFKSRNSTEGWLENWEPLTSQSWLLITKLSFALFVFNVFKSGFVDYGRELMNYLIELASGLEIVDPAIQEQIEILLGNRDKGYRVVLKSKKTLDHIVGIQKLLPEISELVWFLRNSARDFALSKTLPRGILLTGPAGTGKTLLVQAIAGEAQVPVLVLSGSALIDPQESHAVKIQMLFQEARQLAPCIVFIDEIDALAQKRSWMVDSQLDTVELLESSTSKSISPFSEKNLQQTQQSQQKTRSQHSQISLLMQFLIELDGIRGRDGVIVIGATNRPEVLDPAVIRPGRLEKVFQIGLPGPEKRVDILQFYGQNLGYQKNIPWNYLGARTEGFTAADLATLMNESTIKAILNQTTSSELSTESRYDKRPAHTIQTIEHGIDRLTTSESEKYIVFKTKSLDSPEFKTKLKPNSTVVGSEGGKSSLTIASKISILRFAYYQAGKIVLSSLLEKHPKSVVASLWPRRPTIRSAQIARHLQNSIFEFARRSDITERLVGCYGGKAAEVLFVQHCFSSKDGQLSTLGVEDLVFAKKLVSFIIENWSLYSKKHTIQRTVHLTPNLNSVYRPETRDLYNEVTETIENPPILPEIETETRSLEIETEFDVTIEQLYYSIPWWQNQISSELKWFEPGWVRWGFFFLAEPELILANPDDTLYNDFYHTSSGLKNIKQAVGNLTPQYSSVSNAFPPIDILEQNLETEEMRVEEKPKLKPLQQANSDQETPNPVDAGQETPNPSENLKKFLLPENASFSWNDVALLTRDYPSHSLILQSFNKALVILNQNRELVDRLVVELLYHEILRQPEIETLLKEFDITTSTTKEEVSFTSSQNQQRLKILESSWGVKSRKPTPKWIDFAEFSQKTT